MPLKAKEGEEEEKEKEEEEEEVGEGHPQGLADVSPVHPKDADVKRPDVECG